MRLYYTCVTLTPKGRHGAWWVPSCVCRILGADLQVQAGSADPDLMARTVSEGLKGFAARVNQAASMVPERTFAGKVWVSDVMALFGVDVGGARDSKFRTALFEAHRAGLIEMTRSDYFTGASNDEMRKRTQSVVPHLVTGSEFHYIVVR